MAPSLSFYLYFLQFGLSFDGFTQNVLHIRGVHSFLIHTVKGIKIHKSQMANNFVEDSENILAKESKPTKNGPTGYLKFSFHFKYLSTVSERFFGQRAISIILPKKT